MPVDLPTTFDKTDYSVVRSLKELASASNTIEKKLTSLEKHADAAAIQKLRQDFGRLAARIDVIARQVQVLQQAP